MIQTAVAATDDLYNWCKYRLRVNIDVDADCRGVHMSDRYRPLVKTTRSVFPLSLPHACNYLFFKLKSLK